MSCYHLAAVGLALVISAGCGSHHSALAAGEGNSLPVPLLPSESPSLARSQKEETDPSGSSLQRTVFESSNEPFPTLSGGKVAVKIMAHVNSVAILRDEVMDPIRPLLLRASSPKEQAEIFNHQLDEIIDREVIIQDLEARLGAIRPQYYEKLKEAAHKEYQKQVRAMMGNARKKGLNIQTEEELKKFLSGQGQNLEFIRRHLERQFMAMEYMRSRLFPKIERFVTHENIVEYYQQHPNEFQVQDGVKWQDIFIDAAQYQSREQARIVAQQIAERAKGGEEFVNLLHFDNGPNHGEGLGQHHGEFRSPEIEPILFKMHDGEVGPVVEVANGFHVFRLIKRDYSGERPLDEKAQAEIKKKLQNVVFESEYKHLLAELKRKATIEISKD